MKKTLRSLTAVLALSLTLLSGMAFAGDRGTKDEAVALTKKAVEYIKANGPEKAYADLMNPEGAFKDRDMYVVVYDLSGKCLAHGSSPKLVGKDLSTMADVDGVLYVKERVDQLKTQTSIWQEYKFIDPLTKKISPKQTYCEKLNDTAVCVGIYKL